MPSLSCCAFGVGLRTSLSISFFFPLFKYTVCSLTHLLQGMLSISAYLYNPLCLSARQWTCPDWSIHISPKERHVCPQHDPPEYRCCILSPHPVEER